MRSQQQLKRLSDYRGEEFYGMADFDSRRVV